MIFIYHIEEENSCKMMRRLNAGHYTSQSTELCPRVWVWKQMQLCKCPHPGPKRAETNDDSGSKNNIEKISEHTNAWKQIENYPRREHIVKNNVLKMERYMTHS